MISSPLQADDTSYSNLQRSSQSFCQPVVLTNQNLQHSKKLSICDFTLNIKHQQAEMQKMQIIKVNNEEENQNDQIQEQNNETLQDNQEQNFFQFGKKNLFGLESSQNSNYSICKHRYSSQHCNGLEQDNQQEECFIIQEQSDLMQSFENQQQFHNMSNMLQEQQSNGFKYFTAEAEQINESKQKQNIQKNQHKNNKSYIILQDKQQENKQQVNTHNKLQINIEEANQKQDKILFLSALEKPEQAQENNKCSFSKHKSTRTLQFFNQISQKSQNSESRKQINNLLSNKKSKFNQKNNHNHATSHESTSTKQQFHMTTLANETHQQTSSIYQLLKKARQKSSIGKYQKTEQNNEKTINRLQEDLSSMLQENKEIKLRMENSEQEILSLKSIVQQQGKQIIELKQLITSNNLQKKQEAKVNIIVNDESNKENSKNLINKLKNNNFEKKFYLKDQQIIFLIKIRKKKAIA